MFRGGIAPEFPLYRCDLIVWVFFFSQKIKGWMNTYLLIEIDRFKDSVAETKGKVLIAVLERC